jgi:hypothetical protein
MDLLKERENVLETQKSHQKGQDSVGKDPGASGGGLKPPLDPVDQALTSYF